MIPAANKKKTNKIPVLVVWFIKCDEIIFDFCHNITKQDHLICYFIMKRKIELYICTGTPVSLPMRLTAIRTVACDVVANIVISTMPTRSVTVPAVVVFGTNCKCSVDN